MEDQDLKFAISVATVDGVKPSEDAQRIIRLYSRGEIDYETAQFAIGRLYSSNEKEGTNTPNKDNRRSDYFSFLEGLEKGEFKDADLLALDEAPEDVDL